jgi:hypothetical protein
LVACVGTGLTHCIVEVGVESAEGGVEKRFAERGGLVEVVPLCDGFARTRDEHPGDHRRDEARAVASGSAGDADHELLDAVDDLAARAFDDCRCRGCRSPSEISLKPSGRSRTSRSTWRSNARDGRRTSLRNRQQPQRERARSAGLERDLAHNSASLVILRVLNLRSCEFVQQDGRGGDGLDSARDRGR